MENSTIIWQLKNSECPWDVGNDVTLLSYFDVPASWAGILSMARCMAFSLNTMILMEHFATDPYWQETLINTFWTPGLILCIVVLVFKTKIIPALVILFNRSLNLFYFTFWLTLMKNSFMKIFRLLFFKKILNLCLHYYSIHLMLHVNRCIF